MPKARLSSVTTLKRWQLQVAKAKLSQLVKELDHGPQVITLHGKDVAIVHSIEDYQKEQRQDIRNGPNFLEALLKCPAGPELKIDRNPKDVVGFGTPNVFN